MAWPRTGWSKSIPVRLPVGCAIDPHPTVLICIPFAAMSNTPLATIVAHNPTATIKSIKSNLCCIDTSHNLVGLGREFVSSHANPPSPTVSVRLVVAFRSLLLYPLAFFHRRLSLHGRSDHRRFTGSAMLHEPGIVLIHVALIH